ncbi:hypothetical protein RKD29_007555 [Streptomyces tendae]
MFAPSLTGFGDKAQLLGPKVGLDTHVDDEVGLITEEKLSDVVLVDLLHLGAMVPENGESAIDVQPVTWQVIELAEKSESRWRVPPKPVRATRALRPVRRHRPCRCRLAARHAVGRHPSPRPLDPAKGAAARVWELPIGHDCVITIPSELSELPLKLSSQALSPMCHAHVGREARVTAAR